MLASLHVYVGGSRALSQKVMTVFYHSLSMQAFSISNDRVILGFDAITDLVKNIVQLLRDNIEAAIISTRKSDKHFANFLDRQEREQQDINGIDRATTEQDVEIMNFVLPTVSLQDEIRERNKQEKENLIQTKFEIQQTDLDAIKNADREDKERLVNLSTKLSTQLMV